jgi:hypothetical protein
MTDLHTTATKHPHARLGTFERRRAEKEKRDAMTAQLRREIEADERQKKAKARLWFVRKIFGKDS